jgi:hypothetical protein
MAGHVPGADGRLHDSLGGRRHNLGGADVADLSPPPGWTVTHEPRTVATEDADSAFTDGMQWTVRDPQGNRPPQAEWPTAWHRQAVLYAHMIAARDPDTEAPPYARSPGQMDMLPRQPREVDARFLRNWQIDGESAHPQAPPPPVDPHAGVVLAGKAFTTGDIVTYCTPAKAALGITQKIITGQVGPDWRYRARWGLGRRLVDGKVTESVVLHFEHPDGRSRLFLWSRTPANPVLMVALSRELGCVIAECDDGSSWPVITAVLDQLPGKSWDLALSVGWTRDPYSGRPTDIPRPMPSAAIKKEVRT